MNLRIGDIAEELAYQIASTQPLFQQQTPLLGASYFLLTGMPIRCIEFDGKTLSASGEDSCTAMIDLVVCNPDDHIILAVAFEAGKRHPQAMFERYFPDMNRLIFRASEPSQEYLNRLQYAIMKNVYSDAQTDAALRYRASGYVVHNSRALLQEKGLLYDDGTVTPCGALCGLFKMYVGGHSEAYYPVVCPDSLDALNVALR